MDLNEIPYGARFETQNIDRVTGLAYPDDFFRPIPGYESLPILVNAGISNYNSLQAMVNRRFSRGVSVGVSYTYSHTLNIGNSEGDPLPRYLPLAGVDLWAGQLRPDPYVRRELRLGPAKETKPSGGGPGRKIAGRWCAR